MRFATAAGWSALGLAALTLAWAAPADAAPRSTPNFPAPDCPATIHGGDGKMTPSLLSDATHTMKRYEAGSDKNGGEVGCNYYDTAKNYNYSWTLYYLFKTDTAAQVKQEVDGGYGPLGGWAHPDPAYCGVSKTVYAYVSCNTTDAETVADAKAMLAAAESLAASQPAAAKPKTKPAATQLADLVVPIEKVSNGCGGSGWSAFVRTQNYLGNTSKYRNSNLNPLAAAYTVNFKPACDLHDACYAGAVVRDALHGSKIDDMRKLSREACDLKFLADMQLLCRRQIPATATTALANCESTGGNASVGAKSRFDFVRCWGNRFYDPTVKGVATPARVNDKVSSLSGYCRFAK